MADQGNLILLIVAVSLVDTGGRCDSITFGHLGMGRVMWTRFISVLDVLSDEAARADKKPWT
jgi:ABC-type sulfate transport system substrate-binding protein